MPYQLILTDHTYVPSLRFEVRRQLCYNGVHEKIKSFIENSVGIPWDDGNKLLQESLGDIGIPVGYIKEKNGYLHFVKPLPSFDSYIQLVDLFANLYNEHFCDIEIIKVI